MIKQTSKDGKIKSKNFNLFAQFNGKKAEKAASMEGSGSSDSEDDANVKKGGKDEEDEYNDDDVSEKLVK